MVKLYFYLKTKTQIKNLKQRIVDNNPKNICAKFHSY